MKAYILQSSSLYQLTLAKPKAAAAPELTPSSQKPVRKASNAGSMVGFEPPIKTREGMSSRKFYLLNGMVGNSGGDKVTLMLPS